MHMFFYSGFQLKNYPNCAIFYKLQHQLNECRIFLVRPALLWFCSGPPMPESLRHFWKSTSSMASFFFLVVILSSDFCLTYAKINWITIFWDFARSLEIVLSFFSPEISQINYKSFLEGTGDIIFPGGSREALDRFSLKYCICNISVYVVTAQYAEPHVDIFSLFWRERSALVILCIFQSNQHSVLKDMFTFRNMLPPYSGCGM